MKQAFRFFIKNSRITVLGGWLAQLSGLAAIILVIYLKQNNLVGWTILVLSGLIIVIFGFAAQANSLGLKPFTNDLLGWRKAKESYKVKNDEPNKQEW